MLIRSSISRRAVSCEHFSSFAHFEEFNFPSKPFSSRLIISRCRSLKSNSEMRSQKRALPSTAAKIVSARSRARPKQARNHSSQFVISRSPFCVVRGSRSTLSAPAKSGPTCYRTFADCIPSAASTISAIARAIRPLPSPNGWIFHTRRSLRSMKLLNGPTCTRKVS